MPEPKPSLHQNPDGEPRVLSVPRLPGFAVVHRRLKGACPASWTTSVRLVAYVLAAHLDKSDECFVRVNVLAAQCRVDERTVQRALRTLTADENPLFVRVRRTGKSSTFRLVRHPVAFVAARDEARSDTRRQQLFADMRKQIRSMDAPKVRRFPNRKQWVQCPTCGDHATLHPDGFLEDFYATWDDTLPTTERPPHVCKARKPVPDEL